MISRCRYELAIAARTAGSGGTSSGGIEAVPAAGVPTSSVKPLRTPRSVQAQEPGLRLVTTNACGNCRGRNATAPAPAECASPPTSTRTSPFEHEEGLLLGQDADAPDRHSLRSAARRVGVVSNVHVLVRSPTRLSPNARDRTEFGFQSKQFPACRRQGEHRATKLGS